MIPSSFPDKAEIARLTARMLIEIGAIDFNAKAPFTHASQL
jgi:orotate phosphoribosyltransferase